MKKSTIIITLLTCLVGGYLVSCNSSGQKVENAEDKVAEAQKDLDEANAEYLADVQKFKQETADKISANRKSIPNLTNGLKRKKHMLKQTIRTK